MSDNSPIHPNARQNTGEDKVIGLIRASYKEQDKTTHRFVRRDTQYIYNREYNTGSRWRACYTGRVLLFLSLLQLEPK